MRCGPGGRVTVVVVVPPPGLVVLVVVRAPSAGHAPAEAATRLSVPISFFTVRPPKVAQTRVPLASSDRMTPASPANGGASVTAAPRHTALTAVRLSRTSVQGSDGAPVPW